MATEQEQVGGPKDLQVARHVELVHVDEEGVPQPPQGVVVLAKISWYISIFRYRNCLVPQTCLWRREAERERLAKPAQGHSYRSCVAVFIHMPNCNRHAQAGLRHSPMEILM